MPATGAALAASLAFWAQSLLLAALLLWDGLWRPGRTLVHATLAGLAAAGLMGLALMAGQAHWAAALMGRQAGFAEFALLIGLIAAGGGLYALTAFALGIRRALVVIDGNGR
jgi:peptidoglycan biosynthesis protein MviN/MurJ (putative lipid II flippase)